MNKGQEIKTCTKCKDELTVGVNIPISLFKLSKYVCKKCRSAQRMRYYYEHLEAGRASQRKNSRTLNGRFKVGKSNAKKRNLPWLLSKEEYGKLITDAVCRYCLGGIGTTGAGLDRIDNSIGYEVSNVVPCCGPCNIVRSSMHSPEVMLVVGPILRADREKHAKPSDQQE